MIDAQVNSFEEVCAGLDSIAAFVDDPLTQRLVNLHANDFLTASTTRDGVELNESEDAPWLRLPEVWRSWIDGYQDSSEEQQTLFLRMLSANDRHQLVGSAGRQDLECDISSLWQGHVVDFPEACRYSTLLSSLSRKMSGLAARQALSCLSFQRIQEPAAATGHEPEERS